LLLFIGVGYGISASTSFIEPREWTKSQWENVQ